MNGAIRLLIFAHCSGLAGAERSLLELVAELTADHGVTCTVVLPGDGPLRKRLEERGATTLVVGYGWWCRSAGPPLAQSAAAVLGALREHGAALAADVVLTISMTIPWGAIAASYLGKPHAWCVHETGQTLEFLLPFERVTEIIAGSSNAVFAVSRAARATFAALPDEKISIIPPYIPEPEPRAPSGAAGTPFRRGGAARLILTGTITPHKGQEDAILAVRELARRGRDVELVIMGPGDPAEVERLSRLAAHEGLADRVRLVGFRDDPLSAVAEADIVLVCSRNAARDRVVIEGMLLGKPVIAARSGGAIELCQDGAHGLLYAPGDPADLAARIEETLADPAAAAARARRGSEFVRQTFTREGYGGTVFRKIAALVGAGNPMPRAWSALLLYALAEADAAFGRGIAERDGAILALEARLASMETTAGWLWLQRLRRLRDRFLPAGTWRHGAYRALRRLARAGAGDPRRA
jgi:glycosyltransferase involved in cell wall biosynthesis